MTREDAEHAEHATRDQHTRNDPEPSTFEGLSPRHDARRQAHYPQQQPHQLPPARIRHTLRSPPTCTRMSTCAKQGGQLSEGLAYTIAY